MFLSSSNLFSTIKEGPGSQCYGGSAYAAFFSWSKISANVSNNNCPTWSRPFTGLQTAGSPTFNAEPPLRNVSVWLLCIIVSSFYSSLKSSQWCAKKGQQKEQLPFSRDTTSRQLICFLFCPSISHKNTYKSKIASNQLWIFTVKEGGRWLLSVNFTSRRFKSWTLKSRLGKANEKEIGHLFIAVLTENMHKFTVLWGAYFQGALVLKKHQEQRSGTRRLRENGGFEYCYSGLLKFVLRLEENRQLKKEQTRTWSFSVNMCRAHPSKMQSNCKCLQNWGLNGAMKGQWDHRKNVDWCQISQLWSYKLMCCWKQHHVLLSLSGSVVFCTNKQLLCFSLKLNF